VADAAHAPPTFNGHLIQCGLYRHLEPGFLIFRGVHLCVERVGGAKAASVRFFRWSRPMKPWSRPLASTTPTPNENDGLRRRFRFPEGLLQ
jgi:hypothetical protein